VFVGDDAAFDPQGMEMRIPVSFPNGTSNVILVVEAGEAVPWTKPIDIPFQRDKPLPQLGGLFPPTSGLGIKPFRKAGFHILMVDGTVYFLDHPPPEKKLRKGIFRAYDLDYIEVDW
jgi:hypothetical protein